jgi:hypothetical protein
MKTIRLCLLALIIFTASNVASGAPFLTADPYPAKGAKPVKFLVTIGGKTVVSVPAKNPDGSVYLKYDLGGLPDGTYAVSVKAVDAKGVESPPGVCSFRKTGSNIVFLASPEPKDTPPAPKGKGSAADYGGVMPNEACVRFLDKTAALRKDFELKRHNYWELKRDPKAKPEDLAKMQDEVRVLWKNINDQNQENCRWQD